MAFFQNIFDSLHLPSFRQVLFSAIVAAIIYFTIWRFVVAAFRVDINDLVYYYSWLKISRKVDHFIVTMSNSEGSVPAEIKMINAEEKEIELADVPDEHVQRLLRNTTLFELLQIADTQYKMIPLSFYYHLTEIKREEAKVKSEKLHEKFEAYPTFVQFQLDGAFRVLTILDKEINYEEE